MVEKMHKIRKDGSLLIPVGKFRSLKQQHIENGKQDTKDSHKVQDNTIIDEIRIVTQHTLMTPNMFQSVHQKYDTIRYYFICQIKSEI